MAEKPNGAGLTFTYFRPGFASAKQFSVPPMESTQLISTEQMTGVADTAALVAIPMDKSRCTLKIKPVGSMDMRRSFWEFLPEIVDQGSCGSCWAFATTSVLAARFAFFNNQRVVPLSAAYMVFCATNRFSPASTPMFGCSGGSLVEAFSFTNVNGVVESDCLEYSLDQWEPGSELVRRRVVEFSHQITVSDDDGIQPSDGDGDDDADFYHVTCPMTTCPRESTLSDEPTPAHLYKTSISFIVAGTPAQNDVTDANIRLEMQINGPVATGFEVRQDFIAFWKMLLEKKLKGSELVYDAKPQSESNPVVGNHAVYFVGWGETEGVDYWIVANSWGATNVDRGTKEWVEDYGNNGYCLFRRGVNSCAIESNVVAGLPRVDPRVVGVAGVTRAEVSTQVCDIVTYEINAQTLKLFDMSPLAVLPDSRTLGAWTYPPITPDNVGRVHFGDGCTGDFPYRCPLTHFCVSDPARCGTHVPTRGVLTESLADSVDMEAARDVSRKLAVASGAYQDRLDGIIDSLQRYRNTLARERDNGLRDTPAEQQRRADDVVKVTAAANAEKAGRKSRASCRSGRTSCRKCGATNVTILVAGGAALILVAVLIVLVCGRRRK